MYENVPRVTLKLEYHSSSGKDASTMSNHTKEGRCIHTSLKRRGFRQPRIACSRPYCRCFSAYKSSARDDLASLLDCERRFGFFKETSHTIAFCTRKSAIYFLNRPRKRTESAPQAHPKHARNYVNRCHTSAGTQESKSGVLVSGVPFQKSTLKKHIFAMQIKWAVLKTIGPRAKI